MPTIGTLVALQLEAADPEHAASAWMFSSGAKLVMLNAQKIVLIFFASDSFRNAVGSAESSSVPLDEPAEPSVVLYRSFTTASAFGCTTMLDPYVDSSALSLSPTSNTTPSMATLTVADRHTVTAISRRRLNCRLNERRIIFRKNTDRLLSAHWKWLDNASSVDV